MGWSVRDIPPQDGRVAVVTGANSGLGFVTARELAMAGATVVLACRDTDRGDQAAAKMTRAGVPAERLPVRRLDLAALGSVRDFAAGIGKEHKAIDLLINNAGVMAIPLRQTADGFEMQFGTNHLGHFALTGLLLPALTAAAQPRVVTLTSIVGYSGRIDFADLNGSRKYRKWPAYAQSKLANLLFAEELQRRAGGALLSLAAHPGYSSTNLQNVGPRMSGNKLMGSLMDIGTKLVAQSAEGGALPSLYAATVAGLPGGTLYGPGLAQWRGAPTRVRPPFRIKDHTPEVAQRLWTTSESLTDVTYDFS
ncbi:oxidoreductase [Fodinicola acaciae]|uniref:oxidoreductase n=1 Tax=Fodinicola acaciae TaxID=2681555 RepID=UPI0013D58817|nr:oxidoreductase [Fodinicola acaciae]